MLESGREQGDGAEDGDKKPGPRACARLSSAAETRPHAVKAAPLLHLSPRVCYEGPARPRATCSRSNLAACPESSPKCTRSGEGGCVVASGRSGGGGGPAPADRVHGPVSSELVLEILQRLDGGIPRPFAMPANRADALLGALGFGATEWQQRGDGARGMTRRAPRACAACLSPEGARAASRTCRRGARRTRCSSRAAASRGRCAGEHEGCCPTPRGTAHSVVAWRRLAHPLRRPRRPDLPERHPSPACTARRGAAPQPPRALADAALG